MINATIAVMALRLRRDVPSLLLVFALPPLVFFVFTAVFREASTRMPEVTVSIYDAAGTEASRRFAASFEGAPDLQVRRELTESELRTDVATGAIDVGLVIRPAIRDGLPRCELVVLDEREATAKAISSRLSSIQAPARSPDDTTITFVSDKHGDPIVLKQIGAVAAMFLLIAAIQTSATLVDERRSGIQERVACGGDVAGLVAGKLTFGVVVGTAQAGLIVATAALIFGADVLVHPTLLIAAGALTAAMATSFTLMIAACCSTRHQAQTISTFTILISSAVGGSMVPTSLMPHGMARISSWMPNSWSIRAFANAFDLNQNTSAAILQPLLVLLVASAIAGWLAVVAFRRPPLL